jgi:hypothetical protein
MLTAYLFESDDEMLPILNKANTLVTGRCTLTHRRTNREPILRRPRTL